LVFVIYSERPFREKARWSKACIYFVFLAVFL
jgi:hypothetical protein